MKIKEITLRPLAVFTFSFYAVSCFLCHASGTVRVSAGFACLLFFVLCLSLRIAPRRDKSLSALRRRRAWGALAALAAGAALSAAVSYSTFDVYIGKINRYDGQTVSFTGTVTETVWSAPYKSLFVVKTDSLAGGRSIKLLVSAPAPVTLGDSVECTAVISSLDAEDESEFSDGILLLAEASEITPAEKSAFDIEVAASKLNLRLSSVLEQKLGERRGGLASALLLGNRRELSAEIRRDFRRLGISHLLALSGLHLTVICAAAGRLAKPLGKKARLTASAVTVVFYMFLTGLSPSVTRAGIMMLMLIAASLARRRGDSFTNLGIAAMLISAVNPFASLDVGLQLSVVAVFAMLLVSNGEFLIISDKNASGNVIAAPRRVLRSIVKSVGITVAVLLMTLPLMWYYFGSLAVLSPLTTLLFSPIVSVILVSALLTVILSPSPILSYLPAALCSAACGAAQRLSSYLSDLPDILLPLGGTLCAILCAAACVLFTVFALSRRKVRVVSGILCIAVTAALCVSSAVGVKAAPARASLSLETSSSGDAITVVSGGKAYVIDIGNGYSGSLYQALQTAEKSVCGETETLVLTHFHTAHISTLSRLLASFKVREVAVPSELKAEELAFLEETASAFGAKLTRYDFGDSLSMGDVCVSIAEPLYIKRSVQPVVRIDISAVGESFVYLGSSYPEACLNPDIPRGATVCLGSHGPKYKKKWDTYALPDAGLIVSLGYAQDFAPERAGTADRIILEPKGS